MVEKATNLEPLPFDPALMAIFFFITAVIVVVAIRLIFYNKKTKAENYVTAGVSEK